MIRSSPTCGPELGVVDAETLLGGQAEDADLALVEVAVDLVGGLAHLGQGVDGREGGQDLALADQLVGVPGLAVVGEVGALDGLELHPEVAVVVLDHVARGGRAGDDGAGPLAGEDRGAHGLAAGVLEDDVGVVADQGADVLAQAAPLGLVLGVLVLPEPVAGRLAVDDGLDAEVVEEGHLLGRGDHPDRGAAAVQDVLDGVAAEAAARPPRRGPGRPASSRRRCGRRACGRRSSCTGR